MLNRTLIIAEAGVNHNGDIQLAKKLIDAAAEAKVDMVKFQTFKAENLVSKDAKKANYQSQNTGDDDLSQFNMLKKLELSNEQHMELIQYAKQKGVRFFSTAFDLEGLEYLNSLGFSIFKVPSGEITNYPYLKKIASFNKPVILSTGMSNLIEIREAVEVLISEKLSIQDITVLHCNTEYPTPFEDVNLLAMNTIANELNVSVGYSDHTLGIEVPIAAVALGAVVIEKHFTLDRTLPGPDHRASLEPQELCNMVESIRKVEHAIRGDKRKVASKSEIKNIAIARKSIHAKNNLIAGQIIKESDLVSLRPASGINPMSWNEVIGKTLVTDIKAFEPLKWKHVN